MVQRSSIFFGWPLAACIVLSGASASACGTSRKAFGGAYELGRLTFSRK